MKRSLVSVPLYDTLGIEALVHIVKQTELKVVFSTSDKVSCIVVDRPRVLSQSLARE
jgi:long-subunit acyl-CoA synthetase (AMP-forming)